MQGAPQVIQVLNVRLSEELAAINQYIVHASMLENWGYDKLAAYVMARAKTEMKHAEMLIDRILFLEGTPIVEVLGSINIGAAVCEQLSADAASERAAVDRYNASISVARDNADNGTRELFEAILKDEEVHLNDLEAKMAQVSQVGVQLFLTTQV